MCTPTFHFAAPCLIVMHAEDTLAQVYPVIPTVGPDSPLFVVESCIMFCLSSVVRLDSIKPVHFVLTLAKTNRLVFIFETGHHPYTCITAKCRK